MEEQIKQIPLGRQLKKIMLDAKVNIEVQALTDQLVEAAQQSLGYKKFNDLRDVVPTLIMNDSLWSWLTTNEIRYNGTINQDTGAYEYTLSWD